MPSKTKTKANSSQTAIMFVSKKVVAQSLFNIYHLKRLMKGSSKEVVHQPRSKPSSLLKNLASKMSAEAHFNAKLTLSLSVGSVHQYPLTLLKLEESS